ncbi:PTS system mannitol-specific transporter subunit IIBC [Streptococcus gallolyticus]|nr:PTS system mannitol-specific transporter subunit IIBC [Streptococcus gallolyticus]
MENKSSLKVRVQKLGTALSNMVMPNIGAFIAWGIMATLFIDTG